MMVAGYSREQVNKVTVLIDMGFSWEDVQNAVIRLGTIDIDSLISYITEGTRCITFNRNLDYKK